MDCGVIPIGTAGGGVEGGVGDRIREGEWEGRNEKREERSD